MLRSARSVLVPPPSCGACAARQGVPPPPGVACRTRRGHAANRVRRRADLDSTRIAAAAGARIPCRGRAAASLRRLGYQRVDGAPATRMATRMATQMATRSRRPSPCRLGYRLGFPLGHRLGFRLARAGAAPPARYGLRADGRRTHIRGQRAAAGPWLLLGAAPVRIIIVIGGGNGGGGRRRVSSSEWVALGGLSVRVGAFGRRRAAMHHGLLVP